jgi:glucose/arabinose dehydrogenase
VFHEGNQFPASYRGDAFVALHGSWNAAQPTGYKEVHVPFRNGRPVSGYDNFAVGFWVQNTPDEKSLGRTVEEAIDIQTKSTKPASVWGRPAGLAVAKDGSLLIADDVGNAVWRIAYTGK